MASDIPEPRPGDPMVAAWGAAIARAVNQRSEPPRVSSGLSARRGAGGRDMFAFSPPDLIRRFVLTSALGSGSPLYPSNATAQPSLWDHASLAAYTSPEPTVTVYWTGSQALASGTQIDCYQWGGDWIVMGPVDNETEGKFTVNTGQTLNSGSLTTPTSCLCTRQIWGGSSWSASSTLTSVTVNNSWKLCAALTGGSQLDARYESGAWHMVQPTGDPGGGD